MLKIMKPETLLSDKFVEFSQKVAVLHETKKKLNAEVKKLLEDHKVKLKALEDELAVLTTDFNNWEKEQEQHTTKKG